MERMRLNEGSLSFDGSTVILVFSGLLTQAVKKKASPRVIPVSDILDVEVYDGGRIRPGYVRFHRAGASRSKEFKANFDPDTMTFLPTNRPPELDDVVGQIQGGIASTPRSSSPAPPTGAPPPSPPPATTSVHKPADDDATSPRAPTTPPTSPGAPSPRAMLEELRDAGIIDERSFREGVSRVGGPSESRRDDPDPSREQHSNAFEVGESKISQTAQRFAQFPIAWLPDLPSHLHHDEKVLVFGRSPTIFGPVRSDLIVGTDYPRLLFLYSGKFFSLKSFSTSGPPFDVTLACNPETAHVDIDSHGQLVISRPTGPNVVIPVSATHGDALNRALYDCWVEGQFD